MVHDPTVSNATQKTDEPSLVSVMETNVRALVRITAVLTTLKRRIDLLEGIRRIEEEGVPPVDPANDESEEAEHVDAGPSLGLRCDGRVLLNLKELGDVDVSDLEVWSAVVLPVAEACDVVEQLSAGFADAGGAVGGWLLKRIRKARGES